MTLWQIFLKLAPVIFGLAGFVVAGYVYNKKRRNMPMVCPLDGSCDIVTASQYSKFLGIPVEALGIVYYLLIVFVYSTKNVFPDLLGGGFLFLILGVSFGAFIFSLYLMTIQAFVLKKWCTWCLFSAGFSTLIFLTALAGTKVNLVGFLEQYQTIIIVLHALAGAIGLGAATVGDIFFFRFLKDYRISENEKATMGIISNIIWFALGMIVITGVGLFLPRAIEILSSTNFLIKIVGIVVLVVNAVVLNLIISPKLTSITFEERIDHGIKNLHATRRLAFALGATSISSWYVVFILGVLPTITTPFYRAFFFYVLLLCVAMLISQIIDAKMVRDYQKKNPRSIYNKPSI